MKQLTAIILAYILALSYSETLRRNLSYQSIAGYEPSSQVTDHAAIDLDMALILETLGTEFDDAFDVVKELYENGGSSKSYAELTLNEPAPKIFKKGHKLEGINDNGSMVMGKVLSDVEAGDSVLKFQYRISDNQKNYVKCKVGALPEANRVLDGCLRANGNIQLGSNSLSYTYNQITDNKNKRTIKGFSTSAEEKMELCSNGCPYPDYTQFLTYYGRSDYADHWITSALDGTSTKFDNGNANFANSNLPFVSRAESAKKGMAYMSISMYVIRELEDAIGDCIDTCTLNNCNDDPVQAWDEGVAFYTGSLQGTLAGPGEGNLFYNLADKRCKNFKTCGANSDKSEGASYVNKQIFHEFVIGQFNLKKGLCEEARKNKQRIVDLMTIPLIQGTLRYAYKTANPPAEPIKSSNMYKEDAEGAVFAASILPKVYECNKKDAAIIADNMYLGSIETNFAEVKQAFENNYACLNVTCVTVGGLTLVDEYYPGAEPCQGEQVTSGIKGLTSKNKAVIGSLAGVGAVLIIGLISFVVCMARKEKAGRPMFQASGGVS